MKARKSRLRKGSLYYEDRRLQSEVMGAVGKIVGLLLRHSFNYKGTDALLFKAAAAL